MEYKTTYFKIPLNEEISKDKEIYKYRLDNDKLMNQIESSETALLKKLGTKLSAEFQKDTSLLGLKKFYESNSIWKDKTLESYFRKFIKFKKILESKNNSRFTSESNAALNIHLNEIAKSGWKLLTVNPISKGIYEEYTFDNHSSGGGAGFGHNIVEGFVLFWKRNNSSQQTAIMHKRYRAIWTVFSFGE